MHCAIVWVCSSVHLCEWPLQRMCDTLSTKGLSVALAFPALPPTPISAASKSQRGHIDVDLWEECVTPLWFSFPPWGPVSFEWSDSCSYSFSEQLYDKDLGGRLTNRSTIALFWTFAQSWGSHIMQTHSRDNTWRVWPVSACHHPLAVVF